MKKSFSYLIYSIIGIGIIGGLGWLIYAAPSASPKLTGQILSRSGIHWHSELAIFINGEKQKIPANVGLGIVHNPMHTHDETGAIHMEFSGLVAEGGLRIGEFFKALNKQFNKDCILEFCNGPGGNVKMSVNGEPNNDFENYSMKDGDKIEIRYE